MLAKLLYIMTFFKLKTNDFLIQIQDSTNGNLLNQNDKKRGRKYIYTVNNIGSKISLRLSTLISQAFPYILFLNPFDYVQTSIALTNKLE